MKKRFISATLIFLSLFFFNSAAIPWGSATHAYIADHIGKILGLRNLNEIYGSMAPDMFNLMPTPNPGDQVLKNFLWDLTHLKDNVTKVWNAAGILGYQKSLAYGFYSHNDDICADNTAHHFSRLYGGDGYVILKAEYLESDVCSFEEKYSISHQAAVDIWHNIVEIAGDIVMARYDNKIGNKIISAALLRSRKIHYLLTNAYAVDLMPLPYFGGSYSAVYNFIKAAEKEYKQLMIVYGGALLPDDEMQIIDNFAALAEEYGESLLGISVTEDEARYVLNLAIEAIDWDFKQEIDKTINFVKKKMLQNWIIYF